MEPPLREYRTFRKTWSHIVPGNFSPGEQTDLLFYDASEGFAQCYAGDGNGALGEPALREYPSLGTVWSQIVPGNFSPGEQTDLLFYWPRYWQ